MSELLKDRYSRAYVEKLAAALAKAWPKFKSADFVAAVLGEGWAALELKARMRRISSSMQRFLPLPYVQQLAVLEKVAPHFGGLEGLLFPDFVEQFGLDDFEASVAALEFFTRYSSSEFAVRPFLMRYETKMMKVMRRWVDHENEHVRRLASEGCRPRLPWGMALPAFKKDPAPVLPILETLKADPSEYVRRSVANNLNDIAKDHPEIVLATARRWFGKSKETDALIKHACRTLLKRGETRALVLFGFGGAVAVEVTGLQLSTAKLRIGENLKFQFEMAHRGTSAARLRLEYAVDFVKARGKTGRKIFQITETTFPAGHSRKFERKHRFCDFTTRRHHPGKHRLSIFVNGIVRAETSLLLEK